jgi:DNA-binding transcriptional LysR family regulator
MNVRDLECFLAVADELHFGRAAQKLFVSQATVSQSVRRLERDLGGALFDRSTRNVTLTPLGAEFLKLARPAHASLDDAYEAARRFARERPDAFVLAYARESAGLLLDVVRTAATSAVELRNMPTPAQLTALRQRRIHAGIGWETPTADFLETEVVSHTHFVAIVAEGHPLTARDEVTLTELARHPVVGWPRNLSPELTSLVADAVDPTGGWSFALSGTSLDDITAHVLASRGVGLFPASLVGGRLVPGVRHLVVTDAPAAREILAWRAGERHPLLAKVRSLLRDLSRRQGTTAG